MISHPVSAGFFPHVGVLSGTAHCLFFKRPLTRFLVEWFSCFSQLAARTHYSLRPGPCFSCFCLPCLLFCSLTCGPFWSLKINDFSFSISLCWSSIQGLAYTFASNPSHGPYAVSHTLAWGQICSSVSSPHRDPQCSLCCCEHLCLCAGVSLPLMHDFTELVQLLWDTD